MYNKINVDLVKIKKMYISKYRGACKINIYTFSTITWSKQKHKNPFEPGFLPEW